MTQRIFDVDNPQEIFDLFPDDVERIKKSAIGGCWLCCRNSDEVEYNYVPLKINWRDKIIIARPVDETSLIGKLCWFKDSGGGPESIGILKAINERAKCKYMSADRTSWELCRPARRDEVPFADDADSKG